MHGVISQKIIFNPLNAELNPTCHLLELLGAYHIPHVSRIRVNSEAWLAACDLPPPKRTVCSEEAMLESCKRPEDKQSIDITPEGRGRGLLETSCRQ